MELFGIDVRENIEKLFKYAFDGTLKRRMKRRLYERKMTKMDEENTHKVPWEKLITDQNEVKVLLEKGSYIYLFADSAFSRMIYYKKHERCEIDFVSRYLRKGDIFFDIGANIGLYSLIAGKRVGKKGRVYGFEPTSATMHRYKKNIELNKLAQVSVFKLALSDVCEDKTLKVSTDGHDANNSFGPSPTEGENFVEEKVETITLDVFLNDLRIEKPITMLKIDVEGWEYFVLRGGHQALSTANAPDILIEFEDKHSQKIGIQCSQVYDLLEAYGYGMYVYDPIEKTIEADGRRSFYSLNYIATKRPEFVKSRIRKCLINY